MSNDHEAWSLSFSDLFRGVSFHDDKVQPQLRIPNEFYQRLQEFFMERSYLNNIGDRRFAPAEGAGGAIYWLRVTHLPVNPTNDEQYDLLGRWQGVLSTLHTWNYRLLFLLLRQNGETRLYLGTTLPKNVQGVGGEEAVEQLREAATGSMPGIGIQAISGMETMEQIIKPLMKLPDAGAITGIPSFREMTVEKNLQTLDTLAFGIRDQRGFERDYALLVVADPMQDSDVADLISRMRELGSQIHGDVSRSVSMQRSAQDGQNMALSVAKMLSSLLYMIPTIGPFLGLASGTVLDVLMGRNISCSSSGSLSTEYLDKFAQAAEELTDKHIERYKAGRNLGFWNAGVYVLGTASDIRTVTGMLRSVYSGQDSYLEPIRTHLFRQGSGADKAIRSFQLLPLIAPEVVAQKGALGKEKEAAWHLFGESYQYLSTPVNTAELSLFTSLPRRDVPGLRFVRTAVRFASNPAVPKGDTICLGKVVDMGVPQNTEYRIDPNVLVRHALISGVTGSGKSTTCQTLLKELMARDIPILVIEPAKDDYVRWAMKMNETLPEDKKILIYTPGGKGCPDAIPLELNLFEPAAIRGASVDMLQHSENMSMLLNACLPSEEVIPILIDETVHRTLMRFVGEENDPTEVEQAEAYPPVRGLLEMAGQVMSEKNYDPRVQSNMKEILVTRFTYLMRGYRGSVLNVYKSVDFNQLFAHPTVINLSTMAGSKEKSLIMSLLLLALYEYRASAYQNDPRYREQAQQNRLMHFTLVEEAHNVMAEVKNPSSGDPRVAAGDLFSNILSEIRSYGEGVGIVDQVPTRLLSDAIKNTNLKICHRMIAPDDCETIASSLALREEQRSLIPALEIGNVIICGDMDDAATWVRIQPPAGKQ